MPSTTGYGPIAVDSMMMMIVATAMAVDTGTEMVTASIRDGNAIDEGNPQGITASR